MSMGEGTPPSPMPFERLLRAGAHFGERELFYSRRTFMSDDHEVIMSRRRRHQTARATHHSVTSLLWLRWSDVTAMKRVNSQVYDRIRKAAVRKTED